jgi:anti-anti-sigma factor
MNPLVTTRQCGRGVVVHCQGELDLASVPHLQSALAHLPGPATDTVVIDLAEVRFLDCAALRVLVTLSARCTEHQAHFLLAGPTAMTRRLLNILHIDRAFVVTRTLTEAVTLAEIWAELGEQPAGSVPATSPWHEPAWPLPKPKDARGRRWTT